MSLAYGDDFPKYRQRFELSRRTIIVPIRTHNINYYHVVLRWDHLIIPTISAKFSDTPSDHIFHYTGYYSHNGILYNPKVITTVARRIKS